MPHPLPDTPTRSRALLAVVGPALGLSRLRGPVLGSLVAGFATQAALLCTGVITARALGPTDRGYIALVILVPTVLAVSGTLGLPVATTYFIASDPSRERAVLRAIVRPVFAQVVVLTLIQWGVLWVLLRDDPRRVQLAAVAIAPLLIGTLADMYGKAILLGQERYTTFNIIRTNIIVLYLFGVLGLVATGSAGIVQFATAYVCAVGAGAVLTLFVALRGRPPAPEAPSTLTTRMISTFGLRAHLSGLSPIATFRLDQALIGIFLAPKALGLYVAALAFTYLPEMLSRGVGMVALPQIASATGGSRHTTGRDLLALSLLLTGSAVLVLEILAGTLVPFLFGSEFEEAVGLTRILLVGSFFWGARHILTDLASGSGRPGIGSIAEIVSWVVALPAMVLMGAIWGVSGVAAATSLAAAVSCVAIIYLLRRAADPREPGRRLSVAHDKDAA